MLLVKLIIRQLTVCADIHLVRAEKQPCTEFFDAFIAKRGDEVYRLTGVFGREGFKLIKPLTELCEPHRHNGNAVHRRVHFSKLTHGALELAPVV